MILTSIIAIGLVIFFLCMIAMVIVPDTWEGLRFVDKVVLPIMLGVIICELVAGLTVWLIKSLLN
jgi:riboflavin transporter FmnP